MPSEVHTLLLQAARSQGYLMASYHTDLSQANREAPTLAFTSARGEVNRINSTQAIVAQHVPQV